jgi:hypothetical protein
MKDFAYIYCNVITNSISLYCNGTCLKDEQKVTNTKILSYYKVIQPVGMPINMSKVHHPMHCMFPFCGENQSWKYQQKKKVPVRAKKFSEEVYRLAIM